MKALPLSPYTVIDLTRARSGPTCVRQLADMGAQIIKVEARTDIDGDAPRHGFDFQNLHRNKRSITLDLKAPRGREVLERLVSRADVLVENFRPDVKHRLGIDYERLSQINPRLVYASISGFGQDGPYRDRSPRLRPDRPRHGRPHVSDRPARSGPGAGGHPRG